MAETTGKLVAGADLLVVGGPTHMHGMSSATSRRMAAQAAAIQASGLNLDPDAGGLGVRDRFMGIGDGHALAVAFDTRINGVPALTGRASWGIGRLPKRHGYRLIAVSESFLVGQQARCSTARPPGPAAGVARSAPSQAASTSPRPPER